MKLRDKPAYLYQKGTLVRWSEKPLQALLSQTDNDLAHCATGPLWRLCHEPTGVGVSETLDCPISSLTLWWAPHVLSPEVFVAIELAAGKIMQWSREYEFFTN
ncbi:MAG: hypothetical protein EOO68_37430 [Moraxellaceae bacterium]|nr:MAG: hypothetical protein EOO68_37430 [Moraxellaceae bacterium]